MPKPWAIRLHATSRPRGSELSRGVVIGTMVTIRTVTGTPLDSDRLTNIEVRATTNLADIVTSWSKLTNALVLSNGVVRVTNVDAAPVRRFFFVNEPK